MNIAEIENNYEIFRLKLDSVKNMVNAQAQLLTLMQEAITNLTNVVEEHQRALEKLAKAEMH